MTDPNQPPLVQKLITSGKNKKIVVIIAIIVVVLLAAGGTGFYFYQNLQQKQNALPCGSKSGWHATPCTNIHGQADQSLADKYIDINNMGDCQITTKDTEVGRIYEIMECEKENGWTLTDQGSSYLNAKGEYISGCGGDYRVYDLNINVNELEGSNRICRWLEFLRDWQLLQMAPSLKNIPINPPPNYTNTNSN